MANYLTSADNKLCFLSSSVCSSFFVHKKLSQDCHASLCKNYFTIWAMIWRPNDFHLATKHGLSNSSGGGIFQNNHRSLISSPLLKLIISHKRLAPDDWRDARQSVSNICTNPVQTEKFCKFTFDAFVWRGRQNDDTKCHSNLSWQSRHWRWKQESWKLFRRMQFSLSDQKF